MTTGAGSPKGSRTIKASEFKAKCLKLMDEVAESGEEIVITKNGRPTARLGPLPGNGSSDSVWHRTRTNCEILGDIISPLDVEWEADG